MKKSLFKRFWKDERGSISIYIAWFITAVMIVLWAAVLSPLGVAINSEFYAQGVNMMAMGNESINNIQDSTAKAQILASIQSGFDAAQNNIDVNAKIFQYGWILVLGCSAIVAFMYTRRMIEIQQGGGGYV